MLQAVFIRKFTIFFTLYALVSLVVYFISSFTIPAWLVYLFVLLPFYTVCILFLISFNLKHPQKSLRFRRFPFYLSVIFQILIIFTSPASCYGWKQGSACYSFIQSQLIDISNNPPHWMIENLFPISVFMHIITICIFLGKIRVEG